ncbi:23S rRNA pseudouridine(2604) synthase RluF [Alkalimarinus coralli]|uniref:23S rRNA pseudouridine(2604) synthase RluF n=1 Tax=Alkalimarinus coralli TaxID=2935863 RepID=UPI00202B2C82|nr:23S rRNA pseudouridine(2604) synthase RluF [Alkalimarinus coralli]
MDSSNEKRLNKYISESGFCSRREADKLIESNRVTINGRLPELGTKVAPGDEVLVDGRRIKASAENKSDRIYIAYHKPIGITCTTERKVKGNIIDDIGHKQRIFPIGRLDKPSEGLIFLTSDGDIVNKILRAENAHDKEYVVTVDKPLSERFVERMSRGVPILDTVTKPCKVTIQSRFVFKIILTQGLNRQIRRMCEYLGYEVTKLKRTRIMSVHLGALKPGQWRNLTDDEMAEINQAVAYSNKTAVNTAQPRKSTQETDSNPVKPAKGSAKRNRASNTRNTTKSAKHNEKQSRTGAHKPKQTAKRKSSKPQVKKTRSR